MLSLPHPPTSTLGWGQDPVHLQLSHDIHADGTLGCPFQDLYRIILNTGGQVGFKTSTFFLTYGIICSVKGMINMDGILWKICTDLLGFCVQT